MLKFLRLIFASALLFPHPGDAATYLWEFDIELTSMSVSLLGVGVEPSNTDHHDPANLGVPDYDQYFVTPDMTDDPIVQKIFDDYHAFSYLRDSVDRVGIRFDGVRTECLYGAFCRASTGWDAWRYSMHVILTADGVPYITDWYTVLPPYYWSWTGSPPGGRTVSFYDDSVGRPATIDGYRASWSFERASFRVTNESLWRLESVPSPVPIPAGLPLLASALAVLAYRYRRGAVTSSGSIVRRHSGNSGRPSNVRCRDPRRASR